MLLFRKIKRACVTTIVLMAVFVTAAAANAGLKPLDIKRNGETVRYMQNTEKLAVFTNAPEFEFVKTLNNIGVTAVNFKLIGKTKVAVIESQNIELIKTNLLSNISRTTGGAKIIKGVGPVFFEGANLTVSTGRLWIYLPYGTTENHAKGVLAQSGLKLVEFINAFHAIALAEPVNSFSIMATVEKMQDEGFDIVPELARRYYKNLYPDDEYFSMEWYLDNTGDNVESAYYAEPLESLQYADIAAVTAWDIHTGTPESIVGVIDSGVDCTHPEFVERCLDGFNAITGDPSGQPPTPQEDAQGGHGTAVAGVSMAPNNGFGVVGVCPGCSVVPVRLVDTGTYLTDYMMLQAFTFAVDSGAGVINNSWGPEATGDYLVPISSGEREGIKYAGSDGRGGLGTLVVYASGNSALNTVWYGQLNTGEPNVMAVAASNHLDYRAVYSNWGAAIDVCAPSNDMYISPGIVTTGRLGAGDLADGYTRSFGGTSSSAPVVSGLAALVISYKPELTAVEVADVIRQSADKIDADGGLYDENGHSVKYGYGRINAYRALKMLETGEGNGCEPTAETENCEIHKDEDCNGFIDDGCKPDTMLGEPCTSVSDCGEEDFWQCPDTGKLRGFCTWDCSVTPCLAGNMCANGLCARECNADLPCPEEFICSGEEYGLCLAKCEKNDDCEESEKCDIERSICVLDTDGSIGSRCRSDECKGTQALCLNEDMGFPNGYCTHACNTDADCDGIGKCVPTDYGSFCYRYCSFDGDCREGYICQQSGIRAGACHKPCTHDQHCANDDPKWDNVTCDIASGRCVDNSAVDDDDDNDTDDDDIVDDDDNDDDDIVDDDDDTGDDDDDDTVDDDDTDDDDDDNNDDNDADKPKETDDKEAGDKEDEEGCACRVRG